MDSLISQMNSLTTNDHDIDIDELFSNLTIKKEKVVLNDSDEVRCVLKGKKMTKDLLKNFSKCKFKIWLKETKKRYARYKDECFEDEKEEYKQIVKAMKMVDKNFQSSFNVKSQLQLVYYVDKLLVKMFIEWNVIE